MVRFKVGAEGYDARLSAELEGMRVGERKRIRIDPGDKGLISNPEYNPNAVFKVSKDLFGEDRNSIRVGDLVELCSNEEQIFGQNIDDLFGQGGTLEQSGLSREQFEAARKKLRDKYSGDEMTLTKAYVKEVGKKFLVLDLNNPLTGKTLFIDLRIRRILERGGDYVKDPEGPSDEELEEDEP